MVTRFASGKRQRAPLGAQASLAVAIAVTLITCGQRVSTPAHAEARDLLAREFAGTRTREFSGRLAAPFPYVPRATRVRAAAERPVSSMALVASARAALSEIKDAVDPDSLRTSGIAHLLVGEPARAIEPLRRAAAATQTTDAWTDFAAAAIAACDSTMQFGACLDALAASDSALRSHPSNTAARFNRGLALERLGMAAEAAKTFQHCAREESDREWAAEAKEHAARLGVSLPTWKERVAAVESAASVKNDAALDLLIRSHARDARAYAETIYPGKWADAYVAGDATDAQRQLNIARELALAVGRLNHERLAADAVEVIDRAVRGGDATRLQTLAQAYRTYRDGRIAHANRNSTGAETSFHRAASLFERGGSPMALVARYYVGSAMYVQTRIKDSLTVLNSFDHALLVQRGYQGLAAQIGWERGLCLLVQGEYSAALHVLRDSSRTFSALDEEGNRAAIDDFIADTHEFLGDPAEAWRFRRQALGTFARLGHHDRTNVSLSTIIAAQLRRGEWEHAVAVANVASDIAVRISDAVWATTALSQRGRALMMLGRRAEAEQSLAAARSWSKTIKDPATARRVSAELALNEAVAGAPGPEQVTLLDLAVSYFREKQLNVFAAGALLERARLMRRDGELRLAQRDLHEGLSLLERQRSGVIDLHQRAQMFEAARDLFGESIVTALELGDAEHAFNLAERARGRALLDFLHRAQLTPARREAEPLSLSQVQAALSRDAAIVSYSEVAGRVLAFVAHRGELRVVQSNLAPNSIRTLATECSAAVAASSAKHVTTACGEAANAIWSPVAKWLTGATTIGVVPSPSLANLPFVALYDRQRRRFVGQHYTFVQAPSASILVDASRRAERRRSRGTVIVAATTFDRIRFPHLTTLFHVEREANAIAALRPQPIVLSGSHVTKERIVQTLGGAAVLHFAGHGVTDAARAAESRLLINARGPEDDLTADVIASLNLGSMELAYLSACRSGTSGGRSDGIENLALAFVVAGVPAVVASRWDVADDSAADVAIRFHRSFSHVGDPAAALHETLRSAASLRDFTEAAALTVIGGSASLVEN